MESIFNVYLTFTLFLTTLNYPLYWHWQTCNFTIDYNMKNNTSTLSLWKSIFFLFVFKFFKSNVWILKTRGQGNLLRKQVYGASLKLLPRQLEIILWVFKTFTIIWFLSLLISRLSNFLLRILNGKHNSDNLCKQGLTFCMSCILLCRILLLMSGITRLSDLSNVQR